MITTWKFPLTPLTKNELEVPYGSRILEAGLDPDGMLCVWAIVNTDAERRVGVNVWVEGTGERMMHHPDTCTFIGSVRQQGFMWHCFTDAQVAE